MTEDKTRNKKTTNKIHSRALQTHTFFAKKARDLGLVGAVDTGFFVLPSLKTFVRLDSPFASFSPTESHGTWFSHEQTVELHLRHGTTREEAICERTVLRTVLNRGTL